MVNLFRIGGIGKPLLSQFDSEDAARREAATAIYQIFNSYSDETAEQVQTLLRSITGNTSFDISKKPFVPVNITERIVSDMAMIYKRPATRQLLVSGGSADQSGGSATETPDETFGDIIAESSINRDSKLWDAYANVFNTVLVRPVWRADDTRKLGGRLEFMIYTPNSTSVRWSSTDYRVPVEVAYWVTEINASGDPVDVAYVWTDSQHYKVTPLGVTNPKADNENRVNPMGKLPFAVLRLRDTGEFWGDGAADLVKGHLTILAQSTLLNETTIMQGFEEVFFVNLSEKKAGLDVNGAAVVHETGPGKRHMVSDVDKDDVPPNVLTYTPDLQIDEITKSIDWQIRLIAWRYGLSEARVAQISGGARMDQSGVSKAFDNADIEEMREDRIEIFRDFERDLFYAIKRVLEVEGIGLPDDGRFAIDFAEMAVKQTEDEKQKKRDFDLRHNLTTEPAIMLEDNPDLLDIATAEEQWRKNMALNQEAQGYGTDLRAALQSDSGAPQGGAGGA